MEEAMLGPNSTQTCAKNHSVAQHEYNPYECIAELNVRLQHYVSANAVLAGKLEACESENRRLRSQNEDLIQQLKLVSRGTVEPSRHTPREKGMLTSREVLTREGPSGVDGLNNKASLDLETANRLLAALEDAPLHMSYCDPQLRYVWFNHTLKGLSQEEIVGKRDEDIIPLDSEGLREFIDLKRRALQSGQIQMGEVTLDLPQNGRMTWMVTTRPHLNQDGAVVGVSTASIDITEQVEVRECLSKLRAEMSAHRAKEHELRRAAQVTENAIQAKNVFLAIMSHEIRTPLNGLLGLAEALDSLDLNEEQRELVSAIVSSGVIIADILGDILDLASTEFGVLELEERPFDPSEIVQDIMKMALAATRGKDVVVSSEISNELPKKVIGDAVRVRQILKYLVLNAIKFTDSGSVRIRLRVEEPLTLLTEDGKLNDSDNVAPKSICKYALRNVTNSENFSVGTVDSMPFTVTAVENAVNVRDIRPWECLTEAPQQRKDVPGKSGCIAPAEVVLYCEVVDTGVGIPQEAFPTLFDEFRQVSEGTTRSHGGTGLGLAICKRLVERMGGQLTVRSEVGKGSTFAFTVLCKALGNWEVADVGDRQLQGSLDSSSRGEAREQTMQSRREPRITEEVPDSPSKAMRPRILLAEDNKVNVMVAISMLKRLGFTAKVVANGVEALEAIRKENYDLVLLDICMPLMDGLQVAYAIRRFEQTGEWPEGELFDSHESSSSSSGSHSHGNASSSSSSSSGSHSHSHSSSRLSSFSGLSRESHESFSIFDSHESSSSGSTSGSHSHGNSSSSSGSHSHSNWSPRSSSFSGLSPASSTSFSSSSSFSARSASTCASRSSSISSCRNVVGEEKRRLPIVAVTANALRADVDKYFALVHRQACHVSEAAGDSAQVFACLLQQLAIAIAALVFVQICVRRFSSLHRAAHQFASDLCAHLDLFHKLQGPLHKMSFGSSRSIRSLHRADADLFCMQIYLFCCIKQTQQHQLPGIEQTPRFASLLAAGRNSGSVESILNRNALPFVPSFR